MAGNEATGQDHRQSKADQALVEEEVMWQSEGNSGLGAPVFYLM